MRFRPITFRLDRLEAAVVPPAKPANPFDLMTDAQLDAWLTDRLAQAGRRPASIARAAEIESMADGELADLEVWQSADPRTRGRRP